MITKCRLLNNYAVSLYQNGDIADAYRNAFAASELVLYFLSNNDMIECNLNDSKCCFRQSETNSSNGSISYSVFPTASCDMQACSMMYQGAFVFTDDIPLDFQETAAVIMYNIALFCQTIGLYSSKMNYLTSALQLYNKCLSLLDETLPSSPSLQIMKVAIYVNMMQIQENNSLETGVSIDANSLFQSTMKQLLLRCEIWSVMNSKDKQFFVVSMYMTTHSNSLIRSAPAA